MPDISLPGSANSDWHAASTGKIDRSIKGVFMFGRDFFPDTVASELFMVETVGLAIEDGISKIDAPFFQSISKYHIIFHSSNQTPEGVANDARGF